MAPRAHFKRVPPSPDVLAIIYSEYLRVAKELGVSFQTYLKIMGYSNPASDVVGMDDTAKFAAGPNGAELIRIPTHKAQGEIRMIVLLVDFPDNEGHRPAWQFEDLLFSLNTHPKGSVRDYFKEVSCGKVDINGTVHGWFRLPHEYGYYTNRESGMGANSYPRNAQRMAEDAVNVARSNGIVFPSDLDKFQEGYVTALFIVHAGPGAEVERVEYLRQRKIWSHKWNLRNPVEVAPGLSAAIYLTIPEDAKTGVCAHELGHLAFEWDDFYDPNYDQDGAGWDGAGSWDLMAGGSYNGSGSRPAHPAGLHKSQHGWVDVVLVDSSQKLVLPPYTSTSGLVVKVVSKNFSPKQYLILENRQRVGFDYDLPGSGLLVWRVDEPEEMLTPYHPGMYLVQADGKHQLDVLSDWNEGDAGDPFPGDSNQRDLPDVEGVKKISTSFPDGPRSGVNIRNIEELPSKEITFDLEIVT